jgi:hypothetical protein
MASDRAEGGAVPLDLPSENVADGHVEAGRANRTLGLARLVRCRKPEIAGTSRCEQSFPTTLVPPHVLVLRASKWALLNRCGAPEAASPIAKSAATLSERQTRTLLNKAGFGRRGAPGVSSGLAGSHSRGWTTSVPAASVGF